jgi:hypothetical protein
MIEFLKANILGVTWFLSAVAFGFAAAGGNPFSVLSGIEGAFAGGIFSAYINFFVLRGSENEPIRDYLIRLIPLFVGGALLITALIKGWPIPRPLDAGLQGTAMGMFVMAVVARLRRA